MTNKIKKFILTNSFAVAFVIVSIFYIVKINYGIPSWDESLYVTLAWRFLQGDFLFRDEWMGMQMSSVLLMPLMKFYLIVRNGNLNYVFLFFRICFWIFQAIICLSSYFIMKSSNKCAGFMSLIYYMFIAHGIMAISYNTVPLGLLFLLCSIIKSKKINEIKYSLLIGVCIVGIVLCQPGCVLLFAIWFVLVIVRNDEEGLFKKKNFLVSCIPICFSFLLFLFYLFSNIGIDVLKSGFSASGNDSAHFAGNMFIRRVFFIEAIDWMKKTPVFSLICGWLLLLFVEKCIRLLKINKEQMQFCVIIPFFMGIAISIKFIFEEAFVYTKSIGYNAIMIPITVLGFFCWNKLKDKDEYKENYLCAIISLCYMYCNNLMSNNIPHVISLGCFISTIFMFQIIIAYINEYISSDLLSKYIIRCVAGSFVIAEVLVFWGNVYIDDSLSELNYKIDRGPAKGIYTSETNYNEYIKTLDDIDEMYQYGISEEEKIYIDMDMLIETGAAYHLYIGNPISPPITYSGHEIFEDDTMLDYFYELYPDKKPDVIFIPFKVALSKVSEDDIDHACQKYGMERHNCSNLSIVLIKK